MPKISKEHAKHLLQEMRAKDTGETTHFSVVDARGMAVSVTASINAYFGAREANAKLGFLYNSYMHEFKTGQPHHPFALRPRAMPYSSMSPTIVAREGKPYLALGSPGSSRIISTVAQVIQLWIDTKMGIQQAVAAPRVHVVPKNKLYLESQRLAPDLLARLKQQGYRLSTPRTDLARGGLNPYFGGVHAVAFEQGHWVGAADPRRDGRVIVVELQH
ncbi:MAG: hypothetical protein D6814_06295 [Calditrichaeota bacterium]|nr:MAG: hypothetical protein D6814_06295 [Calditrichota bacterium]